MTPFQFTKLPICHLIAGISFLLVGQIVKSELPHRVGLAPAIQLPCAFFSAVLLPLGTFLALRALVLQGERRRKLLGEFLSGLMFLPFLLAFYFFMYFTISRAADKVRYVPNILPGMVDAARNAPSEAQRQKMASYCFQFYGAVVAYPLNDNQIVYFVPSEEDKIEWRQIEKTNSKMKSSIAFIDRTALQFPYLFALYTCTYFSAFLYGGTWLVLSLPKDAAKRP